MHPYKRSDRVSNQLKREVSDILLNKVKDPRVGMVTVTEVEVTRDLKIARIYFSLLKPEDKDETLKALESAKAFVRGEISRRLELKFTPSLEFRYDSSPAYADNIEQLLKKVREEH